MNKSKGHSNINSGHTSIIQGRWRLTIGSIQHHVDHLMEHPEPRRHETLQAKSFLLYEPQWHHDSIATLAQLLCISGHEVFFWLTGIYPGRRIWLHWHPSRFARDSDSFALACAFCFWSAICTKYPHMLSLAILKSYHAFLLCK